VRRGVAALASQRSGETGPTPRLARRPLKMRAKMRASPLRLRSGQALGCTMSPPGGFGRPTKSGACQLPRTTRVPPSQGSPHPAHSSSSLPATPFSPLCANRPPLALAHNERFGHPGGSRPFLPLCITSTPLGLIHNERFGDPDGSGAVSPHRRPSMDLIHNGRSGDPGGSSPSLPLRPSATGTPAPQIAHRARPSHLAQLHHLLPPWKWSRWERRGNATRHHSTPPPP
jgi:hypothetical protein